MTPKDIKVLLNLWDEYLSQPRVNSWRTEEYANFHGFMEWLRGKEAPLLQDNN